jgi:hypothetical protein
MECYNLSSAPAREVLIIPAATGGNVSDKTAKREDKKKPKEKELKESELGQVTGGATDYVLQIEGIKGESADDKHKDWIE